jgi:hypothetical protein
MYCLVVATDLGDQVLAAADNYGELARLATNYRRYRPGAEIRVRCWPPDGDEPAFPPEPAATASAAPG